MFSSSLSYLMKSTEVDESLSTTSSDVLFQRIPTNFKIKSTKWETYIKLINLLRTIKTEGGLWDNTCKRLFSTDADPPNFIGFQKYTKGHLLRLIVSSIGAVTYDLAKVLANILWWLVGHFSITSGHPKLYRPHKVHQVWGRGVHIILWCGGPLHICDSGPCHLHHQTKITTGLTTKQQDLHVHTAHHHIAGILPQKCLLHLPG